MAIKASNQMTLIDLTDAYSVILTNESHVWLGDTDSVNGTQTTTTQVMVLRGSEQVPCSIGTMTTPTGISAVSDNKSPSPTVTITATAACIKDGSFTIPITIEGEVVVNKTFSYSIAFAGTAGKDGAAGKDGQDGQPGKDGADGQPGADAISLVITSTNGIIFKNTDIATTLTAHVYKGGTEVTGANLTALGTIKWYKDGGTTAIATGTTLTISAGDIASRASYTAQLEG
jgi:hypothetical protein